MIPCLGSFWGDVEELFFCYELIDGITTEIDFEGYVLCRGVLGVAEEEDEGKEEELCKHL